LSGNHPVKPIPVDAGTALSIALDPTLGFTRALKYIRSRRLSVGLIPQELLTPTLVGIVRDNGYASILNNKTKKNRVDAILDRMVAEDMISSSVRDELLNVFATKFDHRVPFEIGIGEV
jgi:hypothetical protein